MKNKTTTIWKRYKRRIVCALAGILLVQSCYMTRAQELAAAVESISDNTVEESFFWEEEEAFGEKEDVSREAETPGTDDPWPEDAEEETPGSKEKDSQETVSDNSISENSAESGGLTENREEQTVSENTAEESVSENSTEDTAEESVSENSAEDTAEESVSENSTEDTAEESVSENSTEDTAEESVSENSVSENTTHVDSMSAAADGIRASVPPTSPVIKSVVPKDTTAEIRFTHLLVGEQSAGIRYEALLTDEVSGAKRTISETDAETVTKDGFDGITINTFRLGGLSANKKYSVILQAKYVGEAESAASAKKAFATKKDMLATDKTMKIRYADVEELKNDRTRKPVEVPTDGVVMKSGDSCALYAQVSRLMRAVETDKLKWTVTPLSEGLPKNGLKVKAGKSTYEAVLTARTPGSYQVTATNTLSKEEAVCFQVTVK